MEIPEKILLERLELLETGKHYPPHLRIAIPDRFYSQEKPLKTYFVANGTGRIPFSTAKGLEFVEYDNRPLTPRWETYWFKFEVEVPQEGEWHLLWDFEGESLIYDLQGNPLQAFHSGNFYDKRDWFKLNSGKHTYFIEAACNGLFGADVYPRPDKPYHLKKATTAKFDRKLWDLFWDFLTLKDVANELKEEPIGKRSLQVANKLADIFYSADEETLECWRQEAKLLMNQGNSLWKVVALGHCHIDTAWLWPYDETKRKCVRSWATQISLMEEYPEYRFGASAALHYEWVLENAPGLFAKIQEKVAEGRWEILGGSWIEFDGNVPSAESMIKQFYYGQEFFKKHFGKYCETFFLPDTFGYSAQLPQIMQKSGLSSFITQKLSWNLINKFPHHTFYWRGIDGTKVLTHFPPADTYNSDARAKDVIKTIKNYKQSSKSNKALMLFGLGDGGGGPVPMNLECIRRLTKFYGLPSVEFEKVSSLFENPHCDLPVWYGELYFELHRGTYTTAKELKKLNRKIEFKLRALEILNGFQNTFEQEKIDEFWKEILQHQFHDVLPGSSVQEVYQEVMPRCRNLLRSIEESLSGIEVHTNIQNSQVFVPSGSEVKVYKPFSNEYITFSFSEVKASQNGPEVTIENDYFSVTIDSAGQLSMLSGNRKVFDQKGHTFCIYRDDPFFWDAWDIEVYHLNTREPVIENSCTSLIESSSTCATAQWKAQITPNSSLVSTFKVYSYLPYIRIETTVEWNETHKLLKVEFPLDVSHSAVANYEIQAGHISRPAHYNTSWDVAKFEVCGHNWVDLSEYGFGVAVLNDSCYGFNIHDRKVSMSLLKSPYAPDPEMDRGTHHFTYGVYPHLGNLQEAKVSMYAQHLNSEETQQEFEEWWVKKSNDAVFIETLKRTQEGLLVRLSERHGARQEVVLEFNPEKLGTPKKVWKCDFLERNLEALEDCFRVNLMPFEVSNFKVAFNN